MHHGNMTESGKRRQMFGSDPLTLRRLMYFDSDRMDPRDLSDAAAVSAVDQNQKPSVLRNGGGNHGFKREGPAALHQDAIVIRARAGELQKRGTNFADGGD